MNDTLKSQGNAGTLGNSTMYNLQTKRTLPRDVIKWMQGLDLSYSVKDYRKDLSNGFLIGEIVSRYQPGKIPMHAFQNSQNQARRDNNWNLLSLFFSKNQFRKVKIQQAQFTKIKTGNDPKSQQLYEFVCRLYSVCTKRNLPQSNQTIQLPPTQSKNPNLTVSYLLKDDGLEKLENSQVSHHQNVEQLQKSNQDRVPTRKISPNVDSPGRVDVKGIGIKQQINRKMTSKRKSWQAKTQNYNEESNAYVQKYVFDYLNQIIEQCLNHPQNNGSNLKQIFQKSQTRPTQTVFKNLPLQTKFLISFFQTVKSSANQILTVMLKDLNEIWKFFTYFIKMLSYFSDDSEQLVFLIDLIVNYATVGNLHQKKKINKVFMQSLVDTLIDQVKNSTSCHKKQKIMEIIYDFSGRQIQDKKSVLFSLKQKLGSSNPMYISWLAVLVRQQKSGNQKLVQDFIYYAHQNLSSPINTLRTSALKILSTIAINGWTNLIQNHFSQQQTIKKFRCITDFESIYFSSLIYFSLLKSVINSNEYQTLVKGKNQGNSNTIKVYNPDHERQTQQIKHKVQNITMTISYLYHNTTSNITREVIAKQSVNYMTQSLPLMLIVVYHLGYLRDLQQFFTQQPTVHELKTTYISINPIQLDILQQNANDMIAQLLKLHEDKRNNNINIPENADLNIEIKQQLALMNFCLHNINVKKLNIQLWENIGENFCKIVAACLAEEKFAAVAWSILQKIYQIIFNYDMKMAYLNVWIAEAIATILQKNKQGNEITQKIRQFFKEQYKNANIQQVKISAQEINDILEQKGIQKFILIQKK